MNGGPRLVASRAASHRGTAGRGNSARGASSRDYDRRKKRGPARKSSRAVWRQPLLLGLAMLAIGGGAGGGWWAWNEGWLVEIERRIDSTARRIVGVITPFKLSDVFVQGRDQVEPGVILAALNVKTGDSLLGIDLQSARQRLEAIDWVSTATVERRLPETLYVTLKERRAVAVWQNGREYTLIDANGRTVRAQRMPPGADALLLLGGAGAPEHVGELLLLLANEPRVARQLRAALWVGQRRWNLVLASGVEIWLPEDDSVAALQKFAALDASHKLLSRDYGVVDLRLPDKLYLKKRTAGDASPTPL